MLFVSGQSPDLNLTHRVYEFFTSRYEIARDVEVYHTDLSDDNAFGFTEENGDEQFVQVHQELKDRDYVMTLLHELVHVVQNERGEYDDEKREEEAYRMEEVLYNEFLRVSEKNVCHM